MKLAVLGSDLDVLALVDSAVAAGHRIVWMGDLRPEDAARLERSSGIRPADDWESLLDHALVDAVIVGRGTASEALRAEQLKRLVADAVPLLVVHPIGTSVLTYYELDMGRSESRGVLRHFAPLVGSPAVAEMAEWVQTGNGPIGIVGAVRCDRYLDDFERESVIRQLSLDVDVLRTITGGVRTVNAVGPRGPSAAYTSLQVQMTGPGSATLSWAVTPTSVAPWATLRLVGERGTATLDLPADDGQFMIDFDGQQVARPTAPFDAPRAAIDALAAALPANGTVKSEAASTWQDATAAMEVVDAIELSLQKGRTIEVHQQRLTEQLAFRGTMAAMGCALLVLGFLVLVLVCVVGGLETVVKYPLVSSWPLILLAVLTLFLLLQTVPWLAKNGPSQATDERKEDSQRS